MESRISNTMEFCQSTFSKNPEQFNAVDMAFAIGKLINSMVDSVIFFITNIDVALAQSGTTSVYTLPPRLKIPKTGVFLYAPRPRLPLDSFATKV